MAGTRLRLMRIAVSLPVLVMTGVYYQFGTSVQLVQPEFVVLASAILNVPVPYPGYGQFLFP
jgi:hypothetical protein